MPTPGPRTQTGPAEGYRNPGMEQPTRLNHWERPGPVMVPGRTPGTMFLTMRGNVLAPGQIRRLWKQSLAYVAAQAAYSWTHNSPAPGRPVISQDGFFITRAIRYMTRSVYIPAGVDNSRFEGIHTKIASRHNSKPVTLPAGGVKNRPTVRNRLTSFGSRVPTLNNRVQASNDS